jgi:hypothetical protein
VLGGVELGQDLPAGGEVTTRIQAVYVGIPNIEMMDCNSYGLSRA